MIKLKPGLPHGRHQAKLLINPKLTTAIQIRQLGEQYIFFNLNVFVGSSAVHDEMFLVMIARKISLFFHIYLHSEITVHYC